VNIHKSSWAALSALLLVIAALFGCNFANRWPAKKTPLPRPCLTQTNSASRPTANSNANYAAGSSASSQRYLLTSPDGGFNVTLPRAFPAPYPPEPIKRGEEYAGISYYSFLEGCRCRLNFTEMTGMALSGKTDEEALADRREMVTRYTKPPATVVREENTRVQGHAALSIYTSGVGANGIPEYSRYKFVIARGRVYTVQFSSEEKSELDHPEVNAYFDSFHLEGELDARVIKKPQPEYPAIARSTNSKGTVAVEVTVSPDGHVTAAHAVSGSTFLRLAAEQAALKARFAPAKEEVKGIMTYDFK
jgi:TonB family protein